MIFSSRILSCFLFIFFASLVSCNTGKPSDAVIQKDVEKLPATLNLMPVPSNMEMGKGKLRLTKEFALNINEGAHPRLYKASDRFLRRLDGRTGMFFKQGIITSDALKNIEKTQFVITAEKHGKVELNENESYKLLISSEQIALDATTDIGAQRGLETLLQLLSVDEDGYYFPAIEINDEPRFPWRGLMIDVSCHFMPINVLKRNLDAMAAVKMNVLHFHLCDNQGWRVESKTYPKLHELGSDGLYYTHAQIKEIVDYAADRGIRVMPEFDVPGHATAMLIGYPELASAPGPYVMERNSGIFDPVLNPTIEETYVFLDKLFTEMSSLFPDAYFHIGGDENNGIHWQNNPQIQTFMKQQNLKNTLELQTYFNNRLIKTITRLNKKMMGWEEILQEGLSKDAIIHSWYGKESLYRAASQGYQTLLSNGYYIDLLHPASDHYLNDPLPKFKDWSEEEQKYKLTEEQEKLILGGEATMWAELVTPLTIDSRIWPRTAAIAERLWSPREVNDVDDMYRRLEITSVRLEELGLTHIKNKDVILRNLANGADIGPLKILMDVIEPYKVYTRNNGGLMYKSYSPFTLMADASSSDAPAARSFSLLVNKYASDPKGPAKEEIIKILTVWKNNHVAFVKISRNSPALRQMDNLSEKLSQLAEMGLYAVEEGSTSKAWYDKQIMTIEAIQKESEANKKDDKTFEDGRTEIMILHSIKKLLDLSNFEGGNKSLKEE